MRSGNEPRKQEPLHSCSLPFSHDDQGESEGTEARSSYSYRPDSVVSNTAFAICSLQLPCSMPRADFGPCRLDHCISVPSLMKNQREENFHKTSSLNLLETPNEVLQKRGICHQQCSCSSITELLEVGEERLTVLPSSLIFSLYLHFKPHR